MSEERALVRREPIPKELEAAGVRVGVDEASGMQLVVIPPQLREKANVLTPVQAFQQADPNWRPSLRVVQADPSKDGPHFYPQQGGKLAPRKELLNLLADAAGVVDIRVRLADRERVEVGGVVAETFTHYATAQIRKSDGTIRVLEGSRTYEPFPEYEELKRNAKGDADLHKKWINEIRYAKAKNETKAILRAIRAALQIPHTFSPADAGKPFVVVGWNLAPQDTTAVEGAIAQLYGATPETGEVGHRAELEPPVEPDPEQDGGDVLEESVATVSSDDPEPMLEDDEDQGNLFDAPQSVQDANEAAKLVPPTGQFARMGLTLEGILEYRDGDNEERGKNWIRWALRNKGQLDATFYEQLLVFVKVYAPDLHYEVFGE